MVNSIDGTVVLSGDVDSWAERELAAKIAKSIRGVREVQNDINVELITDRDDKEIQKEIEQRFAWDVRLDDELVSVRVKNGSVALSGTIGSAYEKSLARRDAWINGVTEVDDKNLSVDWWSRDQMQRQTPWPELDDEEIRTAIKDALLYDPRLYAFRPNVSINNGVATLTGAVSNLKAKRAAAQTAMNTVGVLRVKNYLKVRPVAPRTDKEIKRDIADAMSQDPFVDRFEIRPVVIDGQVYLYGDVDSHFERAQAEDLVAKINGVTGVNNYLDVSYDTPDTSYDFYDWDPTLYDFEFDYQTTMTRSDSEIRDDIQDELWWSPWVDSDDVTVAVDDGTATLTGKVDSWSERRIAAKNAIDGGAVKVLNKLKLKN
jgi:osmotically-inducible protein OsmY